MKLDAAATERFWALVTKETDCWIWTGPVVDGHPQFHISRRPVRRRIRAYVVAWEMEHGTFTGQILASECGNEKCVRPLHRSPATLGDLPHNSDEVRAREFWAKCEPVDDCLVWKGPIHGNRYGRTTWHGEPIGVHRLAWRLTHGEIPDGLYVCHHCDNPPCCNPEHLFLGAPGDNSADMVAKGRSWSPAGVNAPQSKLTADKVEHIRDLYHRCGVSAAKLGDIYGVSTMSAWHAAVGDTYKDVPMPEVVR